MKKINMVIILALATHMGLGACEFSITNDTDDKIYISMNNKLANVVSEQTLKTSTSKDDEADPKAPIKKDFAISKGGTGKTPFTKQFDVYIPLKSNGQYERRYRVHMKYCKDPKFNTMKVSEIQHRTIDMKRFDVCDFSQPHEANNAEKYCVTHAPTFEHEHEYRAKFEGLKVQEATPQEINTPMYPLENSLGGKELLP